MGYRNYMPAIQPTALQDPVGQAFMRAQGIVHDYLRTLTTLGTKLRFPSFASPDSLGAIGDERLIDKGTSPQLVTPETDAAYAERLRDAWDIWALAGTAWGMLKAFDAQGYAPLILQQNGVRYSLSGGNLVVVNGPAFNFQSPNLWNTFAVVFTSVPSSWTDIQNPPTDASAPSADEIARLVRIINLWRPAHMICTGLYVVTLGNVWGLFNWGTGTWGGLVEKFPVPAGTGL